MASTIHQLWSVGLMNNSEVDEWAPAYHKANKDDSVYTKDRRRRELALSTQAAQNEEPCEKAPHHKALPCNDETTAFVALLRACAKHKDLHKGTHLHDDIIKRGLLNKCSDALVSMYAKCGALAKAQELLDRHKSRNVSSWTAVISAYTRHGRGHDALSCFEQMRRAGLSPDRVSFACVLRACASIKAVDTGKQIHDEISRQGLLGKDTVLGNALVDMYAKCGALAKAKHALEELPFRDVISWNSLIAGYAQQGQGKQALHCFERMRQEGLSPDEVTFVCILKACGTIGAVDKGEQIHDEIARQGLLKSNVLLGTAVVDMYAKCGALAKAQQVLEEFTSRDVGPWNALIGGYAQQGQSEQALNCFKWMQRKGIYPNAVTFACVLKACGTLRATDVGEQIHEDIARQGLLGNNVVLGTALVDMYAKCGALSKAQQMLDELPSRNVVSWSALIAGYAQHGQGEKALDCFELMQHEGISPDAVTFLCTLKACGSIKAADKGDQIRDEIVRQELLETNIVLGTALVDMYVKCSSLAKARQVLEELPSRNVVSWNALIAGYAQEGESEQALNCFQRMQCEGIYPNGVTFACVLKACGNIAAVDKGDRIYDEIARQGLLKNDVVLGTALVDMYVKCGTLAKARQVLDELPSRNVISWNALIAGYSQQGQGEEALNCFEQMQQEGVSPDAVTFSCVLNSCSHLGLVEDGLMYFFSMSTKYGVKPNVEHYTSMVDLFGRAGHLDKAVRVIQEMPSFDDSTIFSALLGACQKYGNVNVARWAFEKALQVDKSDGGAYVLMGNIYAAAGMQAQAKTIEALRLENKAWKKPGSSCWTDMCGSAHTCLVEDTKHALTKFRQSMHK